MADETLAVRRDLEQQLISRAWKDADFRQALLKNPREAIAGELGMPIPSGVTILVHEETPSTVHLVIPVDPTERVITELSDEELESVAGGLDASWGNETGGSSCSRCVGGVRG